VSVSPGCFARRASRRPRFRFCWITEVGERQWRNTVECAPTFCLSQKKQGNPALFVCIFFFKSSNGFYEVAVIPEISNGLLTDAYRDSRLVSNDARTFLANKARARFLQKVHGDKGGYLAWKTNRQSKTRKESNARSAAVGSTTQKRRAIAELDRWILEATRQQYNQILKGKSSLWTAANPFGPFRPPRRGHRSSLTTEAQSCDQDGNHQKRSKASPFHHPPSTRTRL
jgi:hypothetical protein